MSLGFASLLISLSLFVTLCHTLCFSTPPKSPVQNSTASKHFRLSEVNRVSFLAKTWFGERDDSGNHILVRGQDVLVWARKPNALRVKALRITDAKPGETFRVFPYDVFVSNGKRQCEINTSSYKYKTMASAPSIDKIQSESSLLDVVYHEFLFEKNPLSTFTRVIDTSINNESVFVYDSTFKILPDKKVTVKYLMYISKDTKLPVRISVLFKNKDGNFVEGQRTDYRDWKLNEHMPASLFNPIPPRWAKLDTGEQPDYDPTLALGQRPKSLSSLDIKNNLVSLEELESKVVLIDYWATWCGPCLSELPRLTALHKKYSDKGFDIISISLDESEDHSKVVKMVKDKQMNWIQIHDRKAWASPLALSYKVNAIPFTLLIGRNGKIAAVNPRGEELEKAVKAALDAK